MEKEMRGNGQLTGRHFSASGLGGLNIFCR